MNIFKYFTVNEATTPEDLKAQYNCLSKIYHPDMKTPTASTEKFQELSAEYEKAQKFIKGEGYEHQAGPDNNGLRAAKDTLIDLFTSHFVKNSDERKVLNRSISDLLELIGF